MSKQLRLSKFQHCVGTGHAVGVSAIDTITRTAHVENIDVALGYRGSSATYLTERMDRKLNNKQAFPQSTHLHWCSVGSNQKRPPQQGEYHLALHASLSCEWCKHFSPAGQQIPKVQLPS